MKRTIKGGLAIACLLFAFCAQTVEAKADEILLTDALTEETKADKAERTDDIAVETKEEADTNEKKDPIAEEVEYKDPYIVIERYELSHSRIIPGESFSLTLTAKNNSKERSAQDVLLEVSNPPGVAPVYGTVSQTYLGTMAPGESKTVTYEYDSWPSITNETLDFSIVLASRSNTNYVTVRVSTGTENIFNIMAMNGPTEVYEDESASISLNFRVLGEENVSNVVLRVDCNGETIGTSQVGSLIAGTTKTQSVSFQITEPGDYTAEYYMEYVGADGRAESEFLGTKQIEIKKVEVNAGEEQLPGGDTLVQEPDYTDILILVLSGTLILAIFIVSAIILKKKR